MTYSAAAVLTGLKDFQRASVEHAFRRLYLDDDSTGRFLLADETGLGKTMVAKGVIAKSIERLQHDDSVKRIDVVYVCSNTDIADQNMRKLSKAVLQGSHSSSPATRLTMLIAQRRLLESATPDGTKPVTFVSFTPATSFEMGWQTGKAEERAVLFLLLQQHFGLGKAESRALKLILKGGVSNTGNFDRYIDLASYNSNGGNWEPSIHAAFVHDLNHASLRRDVLGLIDDVRGKSTMHKALENRATELTVQLRRKLARAGVRALEPDLVILDEFQRFKGLLTPGSEAAELAHHLFDQPEARVLLLSATPYKPFTLAEESAHGGEDHYRDLLGTLQFLARDTAVVDDIREHLTAFRSAALSGESVAEVRSKLEARLLRLLSRVERDGAQADVTTTEAPSVHAEDIAGYVALHRIADAVDAPLTVEYWKSAPYFVNFIDSYKLGTRLKEDLKDPDVYPTLRPLLRSSQHIRRAQVERFEHIEWGNARLRELAAATVDRDWWKLLWIPPSLPYYEPAGPYASEAASGVTKRLIFSSWVAAPSAIASLLSHEVERRIRTAVGRLSSEKFSGRLRYQVRDGRPSMTTLAMFWPMPTLAEATDPIALARASAPDRVTADDATAWAAAQAAALVGPNGDADGSSSTAWYWMAAIATEASSRLGAQLGVVDPASLADSMLGELESEPDDEKDSKGSILQHISEALHALTPAVPNTPRPTDLSYIIGLLGLAGPANVSWRALRRVVPDGAAVTEIGLWRAAALLASGFRTLFNRRLTSYLIDSFGGGEEDSYWVRVLEYCRDGGLQAVLDEYLHQLIDEKGGSIHTDADLEVLADHARRALAVLGATYQATDVDHPDKAGISFFGRFALRYGGIKQKQDDVRLPEVRAAFNSPFWPFVLATTSIGQEGVDLHWWCHSIVHWNLPSNPVDFEQREGRVNRFKGHAIRRNVAAAHGRGALADGRANLWEALFDVAVAARPPGVGDMQPFWEYPGEARIERLILGFPMSRDEAAWTRLKDMLALYRLAYGQPRQEDLVELLQRRGVTSADVSEMRLRLAPPGLSSGSTPGSHI